VFAPVGVAVVLLAGCVGAVEVVPAPCVGAVVATVCVGAVVATVCVGAVVVLPAVPVGVSDVPWLPDLLPQATMEDIIAIMSNNPITFFIKGLLEI
jgi:hypothetical protein